MSPPYRRGPVYKSRSEVREADKEVTLVRTLAITQNITVDGSIEMLGDWFDPQGRAGVDSSDLLAELRRQSDQTEALLLGRQTFEDFRGYWPKQTDDATGIADSLNRVQKYVVSSTMTELEWQNSSVLSGDPVQNALSLKQQPGGDIVVTGSIRLCPCTDRGRPGRRVPAVRVPRRPGPRSPAIPRRVGDPEAEAGRGDGLPQRGHLLAPCPALTPRTEPRAPRSTPTRIAEGPAEAHSRRDFDAS
jgi:dihydrofolate reductase